MFSFLEVMTVDKVVILAMSAGALLGMAFSGSLAWYRARRVEQTSQATLHQLGMAEEAFTEAREELFELRHRDMNQQKKMSDLGAQIAVMQEKLQAITALKKLNDEQRERLQSVMTEKTGIEIQHSEKSALLQEKSQSLNDSRNRIEAMEQQLELLREENIMRREESTRLATELEKERAQSAEKLALLQNAQKQMQAEFENAASKIFENRSKTFAEQNKTNLDTMLTPFKDQLKDFEKKVEDTYDKESKQRFSLAKEIQQLQKLNQRLSDDAHNLTNALKGQNKTQGNWGEMILERLLEQSGLTKGREYEVQLSMRDEHGKVSRPDVVVHLPENKDVIIDAKVALTAYERYCREDDEQKRGAHLERHVSSIRGHVKGLSEKGYDRLHAVRSLDYVLMFVPIEGAFMSAIQYDDALFNDAMQKGIIIVSPTTLLATLRTIHNIWRYEQQNQHAVEIANKAGALYDKFEGFVASLLEVGKKLGDTHDSYEIAYKRLVGGRGNLVNRAEELKRLGAKASKRLPEKVIRDAEAELPALEEGAEKGIETAAISTAAGSDSIN
jgi:DNA recombination protein RmuC